MCGRFGLDLDDDMYRVHRSGALYLRQLEDEAWRAARSYDARPSTRRAVVMPSAGGPALAWARWGWRPPWMKGLLINARWETAPDKGTFTAAVRHRRCAIPATCYYEWRRDAKDKPLAKFAFRRSDGGPLLMAGLWEEGDGGAAGERRFLVLTRAMEAFAAIHDRTPVMLSEAAAEVWLDPAAGEAEVFDAARHMGDHDLVPREVVFSAAAERRDDAELMAPLHEPWPWQG